MFRTIPGLVFSRGATQSSFTVSPDLAKRIVCLNYLSNDYE